MILRTRSVSSDPIQIEIAAMPVSLKSTAMSAAILSLGDRTAAELGRGSLEQVLIRGDRGYVLMTHAGEEAVLTVLATPDAKLGLIFLDMSRAVKELEKLV